MALSVSDTREGARQRQNRHLPDRAHDNRLRRKRPSLGKSCLSAQDNSRSKWNSKQIPQREEQAPSDEDRH